MNNATAVVLTKQSNQNEIRSYFEAVMRLTNGNEQFPVNLDEVWPLVYAQKDKAVRSLKKDFIEGEDFIAVTQNGDGGKFASTAYFLSVSCLEYFIARKVRPVFEVYRKVFHKVTTPKQLTQSEMLLQSVQLMVEQEKKVAQLETKVHELDARTKTRPDWFTIMGWAVLHHVHVSLSRAGGLGKHATSLCNKEGITPDTIPDPRFGLVKVYPPHILKQVFDTPWV